MYLVVDHANSIYRFEKSNFNLNKINIPNKYGEIGYIHLVENIIYITTFDGFFISYDLKTKKIEELISNGRTKLERLGERIALENLYLFDASFVEFDPLNNNLAYIITQDQIIQVNLKQKFAKLIADNNVVNGIKAFGLYKGSPFVINGATNPIMVIVDPNTYEYRKNESFFNLFDQGFMEQNT